VNPWLEKAVWALGGGFVSLVVAHFAVGKDVAFVKGQLSAVIQQLDMVRRLKEKLAASDTVLTKARVDLDHAFDKIRDLQRRSEANGHGN
jgi:BMFP domain-containing protein YqiC